jgi:hypothetical protein
MTDFELSLGTKKTPVRLVRSSYSFKNKSLNKDWGRAGAAGSRFTRDNKELGPQLGETVIRGTAS